MHILHGLAVRGWVSPPDRVVEDVDSVAPRDRGEQELFYLWVVVRLNRLVVAEVGAGGEGLFRGGRHGADDLESVPVEGIVGLAAADVGDGDEARVWSQVPLRFARGRGVDVVEGCDAGGWWVREVELGGYGAPGDGGGGLGYSHCG